MSFDQRALDWLRAHHSTITSAADGDAQGGITVAERRRLVRGGALERVLDGGYAFTGAMLDEVARCAAVCTSRPGLVVGGPTAARLWRLRKAPNDGLVHVIAPPASHPCRERWLRPYRTAPPHTEDVVHRGDGIRVTTPSRTVVDMTRYARGDDLDSLIEDALARGLSTEASLLRVASRLESPGRPWVRRFLAVLGGRSPGAPAESEWERRLVELLRRRGVTGLVRQHPVELPGYGPARFDLAIPDLRWALEVDVHPEHRSLGGAARDNRRDAAAELAGWTVRRVAELQLTTALDTTVDDIVRAIAARRAAAR